MLKHGFILPDRKNGMTSDVSDFIISYLSSTDDKCFWDVFELQVRF